jgi:hypothetical protein
MGFIEETGAAQRYRDARILSIYEGTTAIQANDLVGRKTARDGGATAKALAREIEATEAALRVCDHEAAHAMAKRLSAARQAFLKVVDFVVAHARTGFAGSVPYLLLAGNLVAGWHLARALLVAQRKAGCRRRRGLHAQQDRGRALLRRACADARAGAARQRRRWGGGDQRGGGGGVLRGRAGWCPRASGTD